MKCQLRFASITPHTTLAALLLGLLPMAACDQSNSVGKIGGSSVASGSLAGSSGGALPAGGATTSGAAGAVGGGTTAPAGGSNGGAGKGGEMTSAQAGASGGSVVDAGADRYQCPPLSVVCPNGLTTDAYIDARGCTVCPSTDTGGSSGGGTTAKGGAGGNRVDAAVDGHVCPPLTDIYCTNYTTDAYGCTVCASTGTGGAAGGTSGKAGNGGTTGVAGASGSGGTSVPTCQRRTADDSVCRALNYPPLAFFCRVPALPPSNACKIYNGIDSGDFDCCPEQYLSCPDSPPSQAGACTGSLACTYGSHPDPTCRTSATCTNGTWQVRTPAARCSESLLPATCPTIPTAGSACSSRGLSCAYADGKYCTCSNCTVEDPSCNVSAADTWRCWSPPGGDCPTYYPNLGSTCALPANTRCRYTCAANATCSAAGAWVDGGMLCPECNAPDTPIATPEGNRPIASLTQGDLVYSMNRGKLEVVPIAQVGRKLQHNHHVMRVELATGTVLEISPRHPTADGRSMGALAAGDQVDGVRILSAVLVPYRHSHTYDILPASDSGTYYAGGVLIGSTMSPEPHPALVSTPACTEATSR